MLVSVVVDMVEVSVVDSVVVVVEVLVVYVVKVVLAIVARGVLLTIAVLIVLDVKMDVVIVVLVVIVDTIVDVLTVEALVLRREVFPSIPVVNIVFGTVGFDERPKNKERDSWHMIYVRQMIHFRTENFHSSLLFLRDHVVLIVNHK